MRERLFKGKRTDNGEWVYGGYWKINNRAYIMEDDLLITSYGFVPCYVEVIPETVGDYTSLTANGQKIFEGDILKIVSWTKTGERIDCAVVMPDDKTGGYRLKIYHNGKYKRISKFSFNHLCGYKAVVIGNIHDNPELLQ